jgi:hypothetical protein
MDTLSPLTSRHDGAVLGFFLFLARFDFAQPRYPVLRRRMQQFLDHLDAGVVVPPDHAELKHGFTPLFDRLLHLFTQHDGGAHLALFRPFVLGFGFLAVALKMPNQTDAATLRAIMETDMGLPYVLLEKHAASVPEVGERTSVDDVMTPALAFLRELLLPLPAEAGTCFVAMPFSEPFESRWAAVYQPLMRGAGYRTLRAWGGLAAEFHIELLLTLIDKSGALLAELTGLNPNVVFELGYAFGRDKIAIPMADAARPIALANLYGLAILPYDSAKPRWEDDLLHGLGRRILDAMLIVARGETPATETPAG